MLWREDAAPASTEQAHNSPRFFNVMLHIWKKLEHWSNQFLCGCCFIMYQINSEDIKIIYTEHFASPFV